MNLSEWESLSDEDIQRSRAWKVLTDWARGDVTSKLAVADKTPAEGDIARCGTREGSLRITLWRL